ncbi:MAG: ATP-dependent zinc protease [Flavobacteriales bacterium]
MKTIGRNDKADFPEIDLMNISIKIDTGAYTSSMHCHDIKEIEDDGVKFIEFKVLDPTHPEYEDRVFKTKNYKVKTLKSSFGNVEQRFIVSTIIKIFGEQFPIQMSLSDRSEMKFPVLIGRRFLKGRFVVDTSLKNVSSDLKNNKNNKT